MTSEQLIDWGFSDTTKESLKLFLAIPIYPSVKTRLEIREALNYTSKKLDAVLRQLPVNAPVIDDDKILSRLK